MPRTEHSGNQEFGPLTPPGGKRQKEEEDSQLSSQLPVSPLLPSSSSPPLRLLSSVVLPLLPSPLPPDVVPPPRVVAAPPPPSVYAPLPHGWAIQKHHFVKRLGKLKFNLFFKICIHKLNTVVKWCVKCEVCSLRTCVTILWSLKQRVTTQQARQMLLTSPEQVAYVLKQHGSFVAFYFYCKIMLYSINYT